MGFFGDKTISSSANDANPMIIFLNRNTKIYKQRETEYIIKIKHFLFEIC